MKHKLWRLILGFISLVIMIYVLYYPKEDMFMMFVCGSLIIMCAFNILVSIYSFIRPNKVLEQRRLEVYF